MSDEAVCLLLSFKNADMFPNSVCLNSLMRDLLRNNKIDLFWIVNERLVEANVTRDVYTYSHVITAYCKSGKMDEAKRVFSEMEENNCNPNLVTYNLLIGGLCRHGLVDKCNTPCFPKSQSQSQVLTVIGIKDQ
ncbi:putative tetratricopeptide-like helical domain superfamily [Helianthus annuus]|nr:putative tetratricopeptide-like helical domain superfamily [Helianthus annuus]KAJ0899950.1 putative tetratricopeptide-like helical domain superfamily [Helianthus annuus]